MALARQASDRRLAEQTHDIDLLRRAETAAREHQRNLLAANKQLAGANIELQSQNDALVISAEEAEAATEEIETLNEEMQATNEELETLNEEFQATIEELNTTNDELESRSVELQDLVLSHQRTWQDAESAVRALAALLDEMPDAVAAVDAAGAIVAANARFRRLEASATDTAVHIDDDAGSTVPLPVVLRRAAAGEAFGFSYNVIAANQARRTYRGALRRAVENGAGLHAIITLQPAE
ncbi:MAG: hypothetical protein ABR591_15455 [Candidatus Velthaea sp.]